MNYKETLFFVGKCLTITHEEENRLSIKKQLLSGEVDWDNVVKLSTKHYVFPALYCNLKRANFLHHLPPDLVEYMEYITSLNRERNEQIIEQAKELNLLLRKNNITPIFLKGTGNLLEGLYEDLGERMVGDIDFIIDNNDYQKSIDLLHSNNYDYVLNLKHQFPFFKHYPRIQNPSKIAGVEIHKEMIIEEYTNEFNYSYIKKDIITISDCSFLSYSNQLCLSIIAKQINDKGYIYNDIALRNAYDVYLLSKKTIAKDCFNDFNKLKAPLNSFLAICFTVLGTPKSLEYTQTPKTLKYLDFFHKLITNNNFRKKHYLRNKKRLLFKERLNIIFKSLFNKQHRLWLYKRITDKELKTQIKNLKSTP